MALKIRSTVAATALALVFFFNVCDVRAEQRSLSADQAQVVDTVTALINAFAQDDVSKFHAVTAPGFYLYDGGARFDGDSIMTLLEGEHTQGRRYEWSVTEPDVHINGNTAWIAYVNKGSVTDASGTKDRRWLESGFLERKGGVWKIVFMQSTPVPRSAPKS